MKKNLLGITALSLALLYPFSAHAKFDPLAAYTSSAPEGCIEKDLLHEELSLLDLIQISLCTNPSLSAAYMGTKAQEATLGQSRAQYLPTVTLTGTGNITGEKIEGQKHFTQNEPYSGKAQASWLLFDWGGREARTRATRAYVQAAQFAYNTSVQNLLLDVQRAYLTLLAAQESLTSAQASLDSYKQSYTEAQKRYKLGMVSLSDKLQAQTRYETAELSVVLAENKVKQAGGALAVLVNLPPTAPLRLQKPDLSADITALETDDVDALIEQALQNRPEMHAAASQTQAAKANLYNARTQFLPNLSAVAEASYGDNWKHAAPYKTNTAAGLAVTWPLFNGFADTYALEQASYVFQQNKMMEQNTLLTVQNDVWVNYQNYKTAQRAYEISQTVLNSAEENHRVAFRYYQVGKSDILNLLSAVAQLADARQNKITAFYDLLLTKASLYRSIGKY